MLLWAIVGLMGLPPAATTSTHAAAVLSTPGVRMGGEEEEEGQASPFATYNVYVQREMGIVNNMMKVRMGGRCGQHGGGGGWTGGEVGGRQQACHDGGGEDGVVLNGSSC